MQIKKNYVEINSNIIIQFGKCIFKFKIFVFIFAYLKTHMQIELEIKKVQ